MFIPHEIVTACEIDLNDIGGLFTAFAVPSPTHPDMLRCLSVVRFAGDDPDPDLEAVACDLSRARLALAAGLKAPDLATARAHIEAALAALSAARLGLGLSS